MIKKEKGIEGVTFLGGEPFEQAKELSILSESIKNLGLSIVCFTGYIYEDLISKNDIYINRLISTIDLLIDGAFEKDKFDLSRAWVGSSNQRYIFLSNRYSIKDIKSYKNKTEIRIYPDGRTEANGMGNFSNAETLLK